MRILFQGDSVTDAGRNYADSHELGPGYVKYTAELIRAALPEEDIEFINLGISGNRTKDLLERAKRDFTEVNPDIVTILIGVNDTWRRYDSNDPTSDEQFRANYESLLREIKDKTHAKIVLIDPFLIYGMGRDHYREDLDGKIDVTRKLALEYAERYLPLDGILASETLGKEPRLLSEDGVHPAEYGRKVIAQHLAPLIIGLIKESR